MSPQPYNNGLENAPAVVGPDNILGFLGSYPMNLDPKNRLMIPARFKAILQQKYGAVPGASQVIVTISPDRHRKVAVYPLPEWKRYISELQQAPVLNRHSQKLLEFVTSLAAVCELDAQGRVRLEQTTTNVARLGKSVMVSGSNTHFVIRNEKDFEEFVEDTIANADETTDSALGNIVAAPAGSPNAPVRA